MSHHGTGEKVTLRGPCSLVFNQEGFGFIVPKDPTDSKQWVNQLFTLSMWWGKNPSSGEWDYAVKDRNSGKTTWMREMQNAHVQRVWATGSYFIPEQVNKIPVYVTEVYVHRLSPTRQKKGATVFWCLNYLQDYVFQTAKNTKWICRMADSWQGLMQDYGLASDELRPNMRSLLQKAKECKLALDSSEVRAAQQEYSVSTAGFLCLLAHWSITKKETSDAQNVRAQELLKAFCCKWMLSEEIKVEISEQDAFLSITTWKGGVQFESIIAEGAKAKDLVNAIGRLCPGGHATWTMLSDFMIATWAVSRGRRNADIKDLAKILWRKIAQAVSNLVEDTLD